MLTAKKLNECYALCNIVEKGLRPNERTVVLGLEKQWVSIHTSCLGLTKAGFVATRFAPEKIEKGIAYGCVYNYEYGAPSGMRNIPIDSLTETKNILPYDGRLVLANSPDK